VINDTKEGMIQLLQNSKSDNYQSLKNTILSEQFPWFYRENSSPVDGKNVTGHRNVPMYCHSFIGRPETFGFSKYDSGIYKLALNVVREILTENNIHTDSYFILRLATNCTYPSEGIQLSIPHVDHHFPHLNILTYLNSAGGSTFVEDDQHEPIEDQSILFSGEHYIQLPKKERRIVLIGTLFTY